MVSVTQALFVVYKRTGGRAWNKKWGLPSLSRTQKENRVKQIKEEQQIRKLLQDAAERDPVRLKCMGSLVIGCLQFCFMTSFFSKNSNQRSFIADSLRCQE